MIWLSSGRALYDSNMRDMTTGPAHSHLWRYALPLLIGNWLQLTYNAADSIIAGRFIGRDALAAEGIAGPIMNLVIHAVTGMCIGVGVLMSEAFGAKDFDRLRKTFASAIRLGALLCCLAAVPGIVFAPAILQLLAVPQDIYGITTVYLRITFLGMPFTFFYNTLAAGLKSVGDSKTPLKFLAFSAVLNAVLDLIFLGLLGFGIVCSAVTTVIAEAASALLAAGYMVRRFPELCPRRDDWRGDRSLLARIVWYAAPTALQQTVQPVGKVLIQGQINLLGVNVIAAFNAVTRFDDFACIPEQSIASAISTYTAQNRGAEKTGRIRPGFRAGIRLEVLYWIFICSPTFLLRAPAVSMFVAGEGFDEIVALGSQYLGYMAFFYIFPGLTNGFQGFFRGMGKMYTTIVGTFIQVSLRTAFTALLAPRMGMVGVAFSCAIGWSCMLLFEIPYYFFTCKKKGIPQ